MLKIPLAVVNASTLVDLDELMAVAAALQVQVSRDFAPAWNVDAELFVVRPGASAPAQSWWVVLLDNSDLGTALGYHDLTSAGLPMAKVFVETAKRTGQEWSVLFSHEILEMLADPFINLTACAPTVYGDIFYAYENCDACQSDDAGYRIDDRLVSNFCLPSWFDASKYGAEGKFDFTGQIKQPFELLPGGYAMWCCPAYSIGWQLLTKPGAPLSYAMRPRVGSRRERRKTGVANWLQSSDASGISTAGANAGPSAAAASSPVS
ncbi:MAG: hypothetical protein WDN24_01680 [Sphingomonas sp.]